MTVTRVAVDTSVVVAAFAAWQEGHEASDRVLHGRPLLPAHCVIESYSVLTRPFPYRVGAAPAGEFLSRRFTEPLLVLGAQAHADFLSRLVALGITGGACYDALVAATVADAGASLLTRDRRAAPIYKRLGVTFEFVD